MDLQSRVGKAKSRSQVGKVQAGCQEKGCLEGCNLQPPFRQTSGPDKAKCFKHQLCVSSGDLRLPHFLLLKLRFLWEQRNGLVQGGKFTAIAGPQTLRQLGTTGTEMWAAAILMAMSSE